MTDQDSLGYAERQSLIGNRFPRSQNPELQRWAEWMSEQGVPWARADDDSPVSTCLTGADSLDLWARDESREDA